MKKEQARGDVVVATIRRAFAGVVRGKGTSLYASTQLDHYVPPEEIVETAESARADPGTNWEKIPGSWLGRFGAIGGFAFMNAEGFRYYLPACMVLYIEESATPEQPGAYICQSLIYNLCADELSLETEQWVSILTTSQRGAVYCFLAYARSYYSDGIEYGESAAVRAMQGFWKRYAGNHI